MSVPTPRRKPVAWQDRFAVTYDFAVASATATDKFFRALKNMLIEQVDIIDPTGLAADASNYFVITLQDGATVLATWSTQTGQQGALPAGTFESLVLATAYPTYPQASAGDTLSLVLTLHGTQTLPAGRLVVHGRYF